MGDSLLDTTLAQIAAGERQNARYWVERTAEQAEKIREEALSRLVAHGILERQEDRFLWVFRSRRYPAVDGKVEREVKLRIMEVLFSDEIPDPRDVMLICLADACGIFEELLSRRELNTASARIEQVRRLDLIGQAMSQAILRHRGIGSRLRAGAHVLAGRRSPRSPAREGGGLSNGHVV